MRSCRFTAILLLPALALLLTGSGCASHRKLYSVFKSDTLPESKSGWMIQELKFGYVNVSGIDELQSANQLPVYPNPSLNGKFYFDVPQQLPTTINVYTALGTKVYQNTGQQTVDLSEQPSGLYFYRAWVDGKPYRGTLIKQ